MRDRRFPFTRQLHPTSCVVVADVMRCCSHAAMQHLSTIEDRLCTATDNPPRPAQRCSSSVVVSGGVAAVLIFARRAAPAFITNNDDALARIEQRPKPSPSTRPRRLTCRIVATVTGARWQRRKKISSPYVCAASLG